MSGEKLGNAGALGLCAFGATTILLMLHNNGIFGMSTMIFAMGLFYGGLVQFCVGMMEWRGGNTFGTVAFTSFGAFWISFCFMLMLPNFGFEGPEEVAVGWYMLIWTIFTFSMFIGTLRISRALQVVFGLGSLGFFFLAMHGLTGIAAMGSIGAVVGVLLGSAALYTGVAEVLNEVYGRVVLPTGPMGQKKEAKPQATGSAKS